jgi:hypothetical protein
MCGLEKPLADSHLIPAAAFRGLDDGAGAPFMATHEAVLSSNKQLKTHLLCDGCELILSSGGEDYVVPLLGAFGRRFPLYDLLTKHAEEQKITQGLKAFYVRGDSPIQGKRIAHFAIGIFWKAAIHHWKIGADEFYIELGGAKEPLRQFLIGAFDWVGKEFALHIYISKPEHLGMLRISPPALSGEGPGFKVFDFFVPGMLFALKVGSGVTEDDRYMSFAGSPNHPISVSDDLMRLRQSQMDTRLTKLRKTDSFDRAFEKRLKPPD